MSPTQIGLGVLVVVLLWVVKQIGGALLGQQVKGSIPEFVAARARAAARKLPDDLAAAYEEDWLAELEALNSKPISALKFAMNLHRAANTIAQAERGSGAVPSSQSVVIRAFDLSFGMGLLALFSPLLVVVAIAIRLDSQGPSFFRRIRLGKGGKKIRVLEFRFHEVATPRTSDRASRMRVSRVGRFLTRTSIYTLPILLNVVRGDMALVGPPPQRPDSEDPPLEVRPGLVSWQAYVELGGRGLTIEQANNRDKDRSLWSDLKLLALLPGAVVFPGPNSRQGGRR